MSQTVHAIKNNNYFPLEEDNFAWKKKKRKILPRLSYTVMSAVDIATIQWYF